MKDTDYTSIAGYLRVLEKRLLTRESIERVIDVADADEAAKMLSQASEYDFSALKRPEDYEQVLKQSLKQTYDEMYSISPYPEVVSLVLSKYDYHNLKVALKAKAMGKDYESLYVDFTDISPKDIEKLVSGSEKVENLPEHIVEAAEKAQKLFSEKNNPQIIDIFLDKHMLAYQLAVAIELKNDFLTEYVKLNIDFYNLKAFMRAKSTNKDLKFLKETLADGGTTSIDVIIENFDKNPETIASNFYYRYFGDIMKTAVEGYERSGNFSSLEKLLDNYLVEYVKKSKYIAFGPEILLSYIFSKENEVKQIRIIMTCKINSIKPDILRERLRDNYA